MKLLKHTTYWILAFCFVLFGLSQSCTKEIPKGEDPYADGKAPLGIYFEYLNRPIPAAKPGDIVEVYLRGGAAYKDEMEIFLNDQSCKIQRVSDSTINFIVPDLVSSGAVKLKIRDEVFFGPKLYIEGNVYLDPAYYIKNGFNNVINQLILDQVNPGNMVAVGAFEDFNEESDEEDYIFVKGIHRLDLNGNTSEVGMYRAKGVLGTINTLAQLPDGKFITAGQMNDYNKHEISNITRLNRSGSLDSTVVSVLNDDINKPYNSRDTVPAFNAGLEGGLVRKVFLNDQNEIFAVGLFSKYSTIDYTQSTKTIKTKRTAVVRNVVKLKADGKLDSAYNYNNAGVNGTVSSAVLLPNGKLIVVGAFTTYNNQSANRIFALNADGTLDRTFQIGSGANDEIYNIEYNATVKKIAVAGRFTSFNGKAANGVVLLDENGKTDDRFVFGNTNDRKPNYAYIMNSGKVAVFGEFESYNNVKRSNLLILEPSGAALQKYNNIGSILGQVNSIVESATASGEPCLIIAGQIFSVDAKNVFNIFKLVVKN